MKRLWVAGAIVLMLSMLAQTQAATALSQWAPLNASRLSAFGENYTEREVHRSLQELPGFSTFDYLAYAVHGGTVVLYGKVMNPDLRTTACAVASAALGVTGVVNKIALLPNSPSDSRIRLAVLGAIYSSPSLLRYALVGGGGAIHIVVENGRVTLEGEIAALSDARRIVERVAMVPGVVSISNHLVIVN